MDIHVTFPLGKRVDATFDGRVVHTDQPLTLGGDDSAPSPFDLFLAALATCAGAYVLAFCDHRNIPTAGIELVQRATFGADKALLEVALEVHLPADFPEAYRNAVVRAAGSCRVKKVLAHPPTVSITAVVGSEASLDTCA
jgi:ribosomal protein S12 methylthiotransferase accessory factor